ncbi:hypothetical protein FQN49_004081 [Arthroderma sp. PD_2]|nr:hypothetical protein FQN49_004081 [Arthroderma sp. PD_2]
MAPHKTTAASSSKKRRFQVPITQYFSPSPSQQTESEPSSHYNYNAPTHTPHPTLPPTIQSSLLAVGMRVRKAVPEGYRTKIAAGTSCYLPKPTQSDHGSPTAPACSELIPFGGAFKVGNYGVQSFPPPATSYTSTTDPMMAGRQLDEESLPSSSQDSTQSVDSLTVSRPNPYKRAFEIEEDDDDFDGQGAAITSQTLPFAVLHPRPTIQPRSGKLRIMKSQTPSTSSLCGPTLRGSLERENWDPAFNPNGNEDEDFEDAAFLRRREEVDESYLRRVREVRMGGI